MTTVDEAHSPTQPHIKVPSGFSLVTNDDGSVEVVPNGERRTETIAFRLTQSEKVDMIPFFDTFPNGSMTIAMRWLLEQSAVRAAMDARVAASRTPA